MRGQAKVDGDTYVAANGYKYIKMRGTFIPYAHYVVEQHRGRPIDPVTERVQFIDRDKTNFDISNLHVLPKRKGKAQREQKLKSRIRVDVFDLHDLGVSFDDITTFIGVVVKELKDQVESAL